MLASIAKSLNEHGLSIENVRTEIVRSKDGTGRDFCITADAVATEYMDYKQIQIMVHELEELKTTLNLHNIDIRVQRLVADKSDDDDE